MKKISGIIGAILVVLVVGCFPAFFVFMYMDSEMAHMEMANSRLQKLNKIYREDMREPIVIDMGKIQLIIISKEVIKGQPTNQAMLDKNQNVRLLFWVGDDRKEYAKVFEDTGKYFSFLVPTEIAKKPFNVQTTEGRGWNDLKNS